METEASPESLREAGSCNERQDSNTPTLNHASDGLPQTNSSKTSAEAFGENHFGHVNGGQVSSQFPKACGLKSPVLLTNHVSQGNGNSNNIPCGSTQAPDPSNNLDHPVSLAEAHEALADSQTDPTLACSRGLRTSPTEDERRVPAPQNQSTSIEQDAPNKRQSSTITIEANTEVANGFSQEGTSRKGPKYASYGSMGDSKRRNKKKLPRTDMPHSTVNSLLLASEARSASGPARNINSVRIPVGNDKIGSKNVRTGRMSAPIFTNRNFFRGTNIQDDQRVRPRINSFQSFKSVLDFRNYKRQRQKSSEVLEKNQTEANGSQDDCSIRPTAYRCKSSRSEEDSCAEEVQQYLVEDNYYRHKRQRSYSNDSPSKRCCSDTAIVSEVSTLSPEHGLLNESVSRFQQIAKTKRPYSDTDFVRRQGKYSRRLSSVADREESPSGLIQSPRPRDVAVKGLDGDSSSSEDESSSSSSSEGEKTPTAVYKKRWYLLFVFSLYSFLWSAVWSTWGPIAQSAKQVFDWDDGNIARFIWLGNIPFLITMFPIAYLMDVKGMRPAMVLCCGLTFLGTGLRCITTEPNMATWLISVGQLLNGIAGTVPMSAPALLSGVWFPPKERATATGIATIMGYLGSSISFALEPILVPEPQDNSDNNTTLSRLYPLTASNTSSNATTIGDLKDGIMNILYFECAFAGLIFLMALVYFPNKPELPPSISASEPREKYLDGLKKLFWNKQFWLTALAYGLPIGVYEVWEVVLDVNLNPRVSQQTVGWINFYAVIGGCISGLVVTRFVDHFTRQMKLFLVVFNSISVASMLWLTLLVMDVLPLDPVSLYTSNIITGVFLDGGAPIFFELVIEVSYPVGEGVASGFLQLITSSAGIIFLSLLEIKSIGKQWMNPALTGCILLSVPLLLFIDTNFHRSEVDDVSSSESSSDDDSVSSEENKPLLSNQQNCV